MYASSGNQHFFTRYCHRQTYQNYEQSRQKLDTILENSILKIINFLESFDQFLIQKNDFESTNFDMFEEVVHDFGKSDGDNI